MDTIKKIKILFKNKENIDFKFLAIYNKKQLRWLIPQERSSALIFLNLFKPYKKKSFFGLLIIKICIFLKIQSILPNVKNQKIPFKNKNFYDFGYRGLENPLLGFYIGTKGKHQKLTCLIVSKSSKKKLIAIKFPLGKESWNQIKKEHTNLKQLAKLKQFHPPAPIKIDKKNSFFVQECFDADYSGTSLTNCHYSFLASLMLKDKMIELEIIKNDLKIFLKKNKKYLLQTGFDILLQKYLNEINWIGQINQTIVHGDFAPWNIFLTRDKKLRVIDWEYSDLSGLPFYDLYFYKFQLKKLLNKDIHIDLNLYKSLLIFKEDPYQKGLLENIRKCAMIKAKVNVNLG